MFLFRACYQAFVDRFHRHPPTRPSLADGAVMNERTPLMISPRKGFSAGFESFMDSRGGVLFGFANLSLYYLSSVVAFSFIFEEWSIVDSIYYATVVFTTIGFGDVTPSTDGGRLFTVFFALYGIFILGFFAGIIGEKVVEMHNETVQKVEERGRRRFREIFGADEAADEEQQKSRTVFNIIMEVVQLELPLIAAILLVGALYGVLVEGWTTTESIYFAIITTSTVGFGDYVPGEPWARLLCIFVFPLTVAIFCEVLGRIAGVYLDYRISQQEERFLSRQLTKTDLSMMDTNKDGHVSWGEFLAFMLCAMEKVDEDDIQQLKDVFDKLDVTGTGLLDKRDLTGVVRQNTVRHLNVES